jgi:hypothetical protein
MLTSVLVYSSMTALCSSCGCSDAALYVHELQNTEHIRTLAQAALPSARGKSNRFDIAHYTQIAVGATPYSGDYSDAYYDDVNMNFS